MFHVQQASNKKIYPGSAPEFRVFKTLSGDSKLQIRYVNDTVGYTGAWQDIPVEYEQSINILNHGSASNT